jgi:hypothetical protein
MVISGTGDEDEWLTPTLNSWGSRGHTNATYENKHLETSRSEKCLFNTTISFDGSINTVISSSPPTPSSGSLVVVVNYAPLCTIIIPTAFKIVQPPSTPGETIVST